MRILTMPQRSPEWFAARAGCVVTASQMGAFLAETPDADSGGLSAPTRREFQRLIAEALCRQLPRDEWTARVAAQAEQNIAALADVQRGVALEPVARQAYARHTGARLQETGLILSDEGDFGCSPDALILSATDGKPVAGLEIKCPRREVLMAWHLAGVLPAEYLAQVHGALVVTGLPQWHFWGYHPALPPFHQVVRRDDFTTRLAAGLQRLAADFRTAQVQAQAAGLMGRVAATTAAVVDRSGKEAALC